MDLNDSPVLPYTAFLRDTEEDDLDTLRAENGDALRSVDAPSGLSTLDIDTALMPWDD